MYSEAHTVWLRTGDILIGGIQVLVHSRMLCLLTAALLLAVSAVGQLVP